MKRLKKRPRTLTAITLRLGALVLALWLVCMVALTLGTAEFVFKELTKRGSDLAEYAYTVGGFDYLYSSDALLGQRQILRILDDSMNQALKYTGVSVGPPSCGNYPGVDFALKIFRSNSWTQCETVVQLVDEDGQIVRQSGDFVDFWYMSEDDWKTERDVDTTFAWIDLGDGTDSRYDIFRTMYTGTGTHSLFSFPALRMTGYFDGARFEPLAMALMSNSAVDQALGSLAPDAPEIILNPAGGADTADNVNAGSSENYVPSYTYNRLDNMGLIEWDLCFDHTAEAAPGQALVTIYAESFQMSVYEPGGAIHYQGEVYPDLRQLLSTMAGNAGMGRYSLNSNASKFDLLDLIVCSSWGLYDRTADSGEPSLPRYTIMTALRASPLRIAMGFLRNVYLATFALALIGFLMIRSSVKKNLTLPLREINEGIAADWANLPGSLRDNLPSWEEPRALAGHYLETQDTLRMRKNEIERLNTALDYARTAEQNRRQMTSNIAHELKTPLAVVHSYAEGLKEHIAEEKRDKYLDIILSETERMDQMVLEMLDLSRLEAGKVKLARDEVSLVALTHAIFEKLDMAAQAKELQIEFLFPDDFTVIADESRIAQVIENFATNAIKYTPVGGHITVRIQKGRSGTSFAIENESEALPAEALSKVWDSFYRTDESRSGGGTGLGLAIARSIIELHGGKCTVRNTKLGVEFGFTI